jgi:hypothetical protein
VKATGSNPRPLPRGAALARMTGVLFQGRGLPRCCVKAIFRENGELAPPSGPSRTMEA